MKIFETRKAEIEYAKCLEKLPNNKKNDFTLKIKALFDRKITSDYSDVFKVTQKDIIGLFKTI